MKPFSAFSGDERIKNLFIGHTNTIIAKMFSRDFTFVLSKHSMKKVVRYLLARLDSSLTYESLGIPDKIVLQ